MYTFNSEKIKAFQQCRDNQSEFATRYNYESNSTEPYWNQPRVELFVLDKDYHMHRVKQTRDTKFEKIENIDLSRHSFVKNLVTELKPFEPISMSDRTITYRGNFVNLNSGRDYNLMEHANQSGRCENSYPVPNSTVILQTL